MMRTLSLWFGLATMFGCSQDEPAPYNGQFGEEDSGPCQVVSREAVDGSVAVELASYDETVSIVPADVVSDAAGSYDATLTWGDPPELEDTGVQVATGETVGLTATLEPVAGATYELVTYEAVDGLDVACPVLLEARVAITVRSDDGEVDAAYEGPATLAVDELHATFGVDGGASTLDPQARADDPAAVHPSLFRIGASFHDDGTSTGRIDGVDPSGDVEEDAPNLGRW